jgi:RNA polymerase sigma-70 factor (ECF subfamily)
MCITFVSEMMQTTQNEELIKLLKSGNEAALGELYDRYSGVVYGMLLKIVKRQELAEDLLQEVFVKVWKNISSYDAEQGSLYTWMIRIARNLAIDKTRSKEFKKENRTTTEIVSYKSYGVQTEIDVDSIGLKEKVAQLKPEHKLIIDMLFLQGYTQQDAADELGIPLGTVKTRSRMALQQLRKLLE